MKRWYINVGFVILAALLPLVISDPYKMRVLIMMFTYMIIAMSINLIVGYCGQLDFGRSAFVGIGAYFSALTMLKLHLPFWPAFLGAGLFAGLIGAGLGFLCRKSTFDYLTLLTIGFNEIARLIFLNWFPVTGGAMGVKNVPVPDLGFITLDTNVKYFYFVLFWVVVTYVSIAHLNKSKYGRAFQATRDDALAALYSGINVPKYKILNFAIASVFTGLAGALQVHYTGYASPLIYTLDESIFLLQMPILGGLGSLPGSILGTIILVILPEISRTFYQYRLMFVGLLMVVMMTWAPNGLLGPGGLGSWAKAAFLRFRSNGYRLKRKEV